MGTQRQLIGKYVAIFTNGRELYSSPFHDRENPEHCWFSHPDGNSSECQFIMNNRELDRHLKQGEVEVKEIEINNQK